MLRFFRWKTYIVYFESGRYTAVEQKTYNNAQDNALLHTNIIQICKSQLSIPNIVGNIFWVPNNLYATLSFAFPNEPTIIKCCMFH